MSLFFLGLVSFEDRYTLRFPNLTVKTLFLEYYNELMNISVSSGSDQLQAKSPETKFGVKRVLLSLGGFIPAGAYCLIQQV